MGKLKKCNHQTLKIQVFLEKAKNKNKNKI